MVDDRDFRRLMRAAYRSDRASPDPSVGNPLSERYELGVEVGRGGSAIVYRARDKTLDRAVALKVLAVGDPNATRLARRFLREARIAGRLQHPGIVPIHDIGEADGRPFIAMRLVEGATLAKLLEERSEPFTDHRRLLGIFETVCQTMAFAHARGVIHRDLKPTNVMVGAFGEVQVMDWGLAKELRESTDDDARAAREAEEGPDDSKVVDPVQSHSGSVMGTPAYMPPEQARGAIEEIDVRADVFSLGAILVEILSGFPPYRAEDCITTTLELAREATLGPCLDRLTAANADPALDRLARECLRPDPADRPATAGAVAETLAAYLNTVEERARDAQIGAAEANARARSERRSRRVTLAAATVVVLAVIGAFATWTWLDQRRRTRQADVATRIASSERAAREAWAKAEAADDAGTEQWRLARTAAESAVQVAAIQDAAEDDRSRVELLRQTIANAYDRAATAKLVREKDRALADRLHEIGHSGMLTPGLVSAFAKALFDYDPAFELADDAAIDRAGRRALTSTVSAEITEAIAHSVALTSLNSSVYPRLVKLLLRLDDDPDRGRLLEAIAAQDETFIRDFAAKKDLLESPWSTTRLAAEALAHIGDRKGAIEIYRAAWRHDPGHVRAAQRLLVLLNRQVARGAEADPDLVRIATVVSAFGSTDVSIRAFCASALASAGRNADAKREIDQLLALAPDTPMVLSCAALIHQQTGDVDGAIEYLRKLIRVAPRREWGEYLTLIRLEQRRAPSRAIETARAMTAAFPRLYLSWQTLAFELRRRGRGAAAVGASRRLHELLQTDKTLTIRHHPSVMNRKNDRDFVLADCLFKLHRFREAIAAYDRYLARVPGDSQALHGLAKSLCEVGDMERAVEAIEKIADKPDIAIDVAQLFTRAGRNESALDALERARAGSGNAVRVSYIRRQARLAEVLDQVMQGERPLDDGIRARLAVVALRRGKALWAAKGFRGQEPPRAGPLPWTMHAARACVRAAAAEPQEAREWRDEARRHLEAGVRIAEEVAGSNRAAGYHVWAAITPWLEHRDLAPVRDEAALARLPEAERAAWRNLWRDVVTVRGDLMPPRAETPQRVPQGGR